MKKSASFVLSSMLLVTAFLAGCSDKTAAPTPAATTAPTVAPVATAAPTPTPKPEGPQPGGTVTYGYIQPFKGVLDPAWYGGEDDSLILSFMTDSFFKTGDDLKTYPHLAEWKESPDHKVFTFTIKKGVKWHNGDELTVEDWKFALEVIASKEYTEAKGARYSNVEMIQGVEEYRDGKAKEISGIKVIDPYTIEMTMKQAAVNTLDNLWNYPMNKKYFAGIAIKDMQNSDQVRKNPIGIGAFKVKKVQPGEFVELVRNDDYWQGKPFLDGVVYKVVEGALATSLLQKGEIDIMQPPNSQFKDIEKLTNVEIKKEASLGFSYIGFKLGKWDKKTEKITVDPKSKFADKKLRQAMYYALDRQGLVDAFTNGLGVPIAVPMPTVSWAMIPADQVNNYAYDPEKSKKMLDEAGYKDTNGDGMREDPQGKKLTMNFDAMSGSEIAEPRAQAIIQMFRDVGLDVKLNGGALKELNTFYDLVENDDPSVELFMGAWSMASDPDPTGLWRSNDFWNFPRWFSPESEKLIAEGIGEKAFDQTYRKQVYFDWQKIVNEEVPMMYLNAPVDVNVINKRLQGVHTNSFSNQDDVHKWWVKQ